MLAWFFLFKQKTAYEMRISDWSSDVCSSDLAFRVGGIHRQRRFDVGQSGVPVVEETVGAGAQHQDVGAVGRMGLGTAEIGDGIGVVADDGGGHRAVDQQIGRASCRERVGPYV